LAHLRRFHELGARYMTLTWSIASPVGGSSGDDSDGQGLTDAGRAIIDEMHRLGMVVDLSHVSDPLFWDAIRYARRPVIASHSSARALANVPRNMTDAMLKAVARNGGAVCVNFGSGCLGSDFDGVGGTPAGLEDASKLPAVTVELRKRGYTPDEVEKILGGNTLRVLEANER